MTTPNGSNPSGSLNPGDFRPLQLATSEDAKTAMKTGVLGAFGDAEDELDDQVKTPLGGKPDIEQVPIDSTMWHTMNPREQATFPRAQLVQHVNSSTNGGGSGDSSHSHVIQRYASIPDYQPSGNNSDFAEIGFIRISKDCQFDKAGFITGDSQTFLDILGAYLGVYKMNSTTGDLTLLNTATYTQNLKDSITTTNTEHIFSLGATFTALQNEVFAVAIVQDTSVVQTAASLMCTRITDLNRDTSAARPRKAYAFAGPYTSGLLPTTIAESSQNFSASTKLPFFYLREV